MQRPPKEQFETDGRVWFRSALSQEELRLLDEVSQLQDKAGQRISTNEQISRILNTHGALLNTVHQIQPKAKPVRVVAFNKSPSKNWGVLWHQDRVIAVSEKHEKDGFHNWTKKSDTWHCEPPLNLLKEMLFVRIHLDDTDEKNGAMDIAVGSHQEGIIPSDLAKKHAEQYQVESCEAKRGDILILKMLTLHSSKPSSVSTQRRAIRIDFSCVDLPAPLKWIE